MVLLTHKAQSQHDKKTVEKYVMQINSTVNFSHSAFPF